MSPREAAQRRPQSGTRPHNVWSRKLGGGKGIRTPERLPVAGFQNRPDFRRQRVETTHKAHTSAGPLVPLRDRSRRFPGWAALALALSACADDGGPAPDEPAPVVEYVASEPCPVVEPAPEPTPTPVPHPLDGTPPPVVEPAGVYCTPGIVWEFGPGRAVSLYHSTTGQLQRGWVAQLDDEITLVWQRPCAVAETGTPALCELAETWPVVVTADSVTVGGVTAVGEWAGGCDL